MAYTDDGIVADTFINSHKDEAGKLQMTYVFTKGIYNGYIRILGEKKTTTTTPTTTTTVTTKANPDETTEYKLGDVNNDRMINAVDASEVLTYYAMTSTNKNGDLDANQKLAADVDRNGSINAVDASNILSYYAYVSTTKETPMSMEEFIKKK